MSAPSVRAVLLGLVASAAVLLTSGSAVAQPYEQVTRASGPYLDAPNLPGQDARGVGDVGRFAAFGQYVRDIRTNTTTTPGGAGTQYIFGMDRLETKVLIARAVGTRIELAVTPLVGGGASQVIATWPGVKSYQQVVPEAILSADGSTVILADQAA